MTHSTTRRQRHCMVVHNYYPLGEPRVQRQAKALIEAGLSVDVVCLKRANEVPYEVVDGVGIHRLPVLRDKTRGPIKQFGEYLLFFFLAFLRVSRLHIQRRYQVVQVHNLPDFLVFTAMIPRLMGAAVILDLHDLMPEFYMARFDSDEQAWLVRVVRWQEYISCKFASHVITVTKLWRNTLIHRGVSATKCSVVMNVADERIFHDSLSATRSRTAFHLIYHGNLTYRYGIDLVLQALKLARPSIPDLYLTIHGRGDYLPQLQALARELDLLDIVNFSVELIPMADLPKLIVSADVGLVPYRQDVFTDGILPTKLMEYAALAMPTIVAHTSAIAAYFDDSMVAYFQPCDSDELAQMIIALSNDSARRSSLSRNIRRFNEQHSWSQQKDQYVSLVRGLGLP